MLNAWRTESEHAKLGLGIPWGGIAWAVTAIVIHGSESEPAGVDEEDRVTRRNEVTIRSALKNALWTTTLRCC